MFDKQDIKIGQRVKCISNNVSYFTKGKIYKVSYTSSNSSTLYIFDDDMDDDGFTFAEFEEYFEIVNLTKKDINRETKYNTVLGKISLLVAEANNIQLASNGLLNEVVVIHTDNDLLEWHESTC